LGDSPAKKPGTCAPPRALRDDLDDPLGNVQQIAEHGLEIEDVEEVLINPTGQGVSSSSGLPAVWGYSLEDVYIIVVYEQVGEDTIRVVTAYQVPEP
jgi:uncharacterized DUF497 family protein